MPLRNDVCSVYPLTTAQPVYRTVDPVSSYCKRCGGKTCGDIIKNGMPFVGNSPH